MFTLTYRPLVVLWLLGGIVALPASVSVRARITAAGPVTNTKEAAIVAIVNNENPADALSLHELRRILRNQAPRHVTGRQAIRLQRAGQQRIHTGGRRGRHGQDRDNHWRTAALTGLRFQAASKVGR
jgi:hypothetical protein